MKTVLQISLATLASSVRAFNAETHLITARIAYDILSLKNPQALSQATELLSKYSDRIT